MYEERSRMGYPITNTIRQFLSERAWLTDDNEVSEADSLLEKGVIDSMAMVELISFIERTYHIHIEDEELMPENFDCLASMARFVESKQNGGR
jgi:acyl carrier protein